MRRPDAINSSNRRALTPRVYINTQTAAAAAVRLCKYTNIYSNIQPSVCDRERERERNNYNESESEERVVTTPFSMRVTADKMAASHVTSQGAVV